MFRVLWRCCLTREALTSQGQGQWAWREWYKHRALCAGQWATKRVIGSYIVEFKLQASSPKSPIITPPENKKPKGMNGMYIYIPALTGAGEVRRCHPIALPRLLRATRTISNPPTVASRVTDATGAHRCLTGRTWWQTVVLGWVHR